MGASQQDTLTNEPGNQIPPKIDTAAWIGILLIVLAAIIGFIVADTSQGKDIKSNTERIVELRRELTDDIKEIKADVKKLLQRPATPVSRNEQAEFFTVGPLSGYNSNSCP